MPSIWTMGEILVEIMRPRPDMPLSEPGEFLGPYPTGAPAIFIDAVARLGEHTGITAASSAASARTTSAAACWTACKRTASIAAT